MYHCSSPKSKTFCWVLISLSSSSFCALGVSTAGQKSSLLPFQELHYTTTLKLLKKIAKTGSLCCVAAGPHGANSPASARDLTVSYSEPRWRTNSSFSPPPLRRWDCRWQLDGGSHGIHGSSLSSNSRGSRSWVGSERYTNHQHSASDGALSYSDSSTDNVHEPRLTSPIPKLNLGEFASCNAGGSRPQTSWCPVSSERQFAVRATIATPSFGSPSSFSESSHWESTSKQPFTFANGNFPRRRSYMSKAVYPLVFRNPVSDNEPTGDTEISNVGRLTPIGDQTPSCWPDNSSSIDYKFPKNLSELQKSDTSPDPSISSRRDGFRWSNASSYDLGLDGERFDIGEHMEVENLRSPIRPVADQKCGVCGKFLCQKSPWSSHRIMRCGDMPTAGVLPCKHVFHAECLEQVTPNIQIHDPPCPLCLKVIGATEESPSFSQPLQMALRSLRRSRGVVISEAEGSQSNIEGSNNVRDRLRKSWPRRAAQLNKTGSSIASRIKSHFPFKVKVGKDIFSTTVFRRIGSSSSQQPVEQ